jgi:hypothetical protein
MKKILLFTIMATAIGTRSQAQFSEFKDLNSFSPFTISNDNNTLQLGGRIGFYYENRILKSGYTNLDHNGFDVKDMDLDIFGKTAGKFVYECHYSLIDIVTAATTANSSPMTPGFKAAYIAYEGFKIHIKFGYDKVPYSQSNISHEHASPFWSHPNLTGGDFYARRDLGLTLNTSLLKDKLNLYAGAYSGLGETVFQYGGDASGTFEYVGRAEFSYPGKMKYNLIDEENSPIVHFRVAANARYEDKTQPGGGTIAANYPDAVGAYSTYMVNGKRTIYGGDAMIVYRGFSLQLEEDILNIKPTSQADPLFNGTAESLNKGVVNAGGFVSALNYDWLKAKSVFSVGYENTNANDLQIGHMEWVTLAYAYTFNSFNSCAKIEYYIPTVEDVNAKPLKYTGQLRIGYQIVF